MTLSIRSILLSLSALLVTGTLTACDSADELEALGVDVAELDDMTEEELDALPCLDDLDIATPPLAPLPPVPRPPVPERALVPVDHDLEQAEAPFFAHPADLLASDKLGLPDDDDGCDSNGDQLDIAAD